MCEVREPRLDPGALACERREAPLQLLLFARERTAERARLGLLAPLLAARGPPGGRGGRFGRAAGAQPCGVILQVPLEGRERAVGDQHEAITGAAQQRTVVRDDDDGAGELLQRQQQRVPQRQVQVVGRLIEQQQIGAARHQDRERQPRALPTGEVEGGLEHALAAKTEAAQADRAAAAASRPVTSAPPRRTSSLSGEPPPSSCSTSSCAKKPTASSGEGVRVPAWGAKEGFGRGQFTIRDGRRASSSRAYLRPARGRVNLTVETGAHALGVVMAGTRAVGVDYVKGSGDKVRAEAGGEVVLASGTFNTPQLLMLSGVGPAAHLAEIGIRTLVDLPVGRNLQDHLGSYMTYSRTQPGSFHREMRFDRMAVSMIRAYLFGTGPATVVPGGLHAFIKTRPELAVPDIEFMFRGTSHHPRLWFPLVRAPYVDGFGIRPTLLHPDSRGEILLRSSDPRAAPRIRYNFFSAPNDLPTLRQGFKLARKLVGQQALDPYRGDELNPGPQVQSDAEIDAWLRKTVITAHHPCGTCPMGATSDAVLDADMRVRGTERLRVVDASAMPDLVSAHINACVLMMAEKAADLIRGRAPLPSLLGV